MPWYVESPGGLTVIFEVCLSAKPGLLRSSDALSLFLGPFLLCLLAFSAKGSEL